MALSFLAGYGGLFTCDTVKAGQQLGQLNFDDGIGLPWHICESETGKMDFEVKDGKYQITIVNPGGTSNGGETDGTVSSDTEDLRSLQVISTRSPTR